MIAPLPLLLLLQSSPASAPALETATRTVDAGGEKFLAYFSRQPGGARPGLVVVHEWWGLNDQIRGVADRLAREGYATIVPDLYGGKVATDRDLAHELSRGLEDGKAVKILRAAVTSVRAEGGADRGRIGAIGFCMGGKYSLLLGLEEDALRAAVVCYGSVITDAEKLATLRCPVLGVFGAEDRGIPTESVKAFEEAAKKAGKSARASIYDGVGHAFLNDSRPDHKPEVAARAWKEILGFLRERLGPG